MPLVGCKMDYFRSYLFSIAQFETVSFDYFVISTRAGSELQDKLENKLIRYR